MTYEKVVQRPDPRLPDSWCREGVTHDHQACGLGSMWDSSNPRDIEEAVRWADEQGRPALSIPERNPKPMAEYVYRQSEPTLWTVGHTGPGGCGPNRDWHPESDHGTETEAAARVHYLNGGCDGTREFPAVITVERLRQALRADDHTTDDGQYGRAAYVRLDKDEPSDAPPFLAIAVADVLAILDAER